MCFKLVKKFYGLDKIKDTSFKTEIIAGLTTFITLSYLFFVTPLLLKDINIDPQAAFTSLVLASLFGTLFMSLFAKKPFALAPSFVLVTYFTYSVVIGQGVQWQTALGALFIASILYAFIASSRLKDKLIDIIPPTMKMAIVSGIGLFLVVIGLKLSGILISNHKLFLYIGNLTTSTALLTFLGIVILIFLLAKEKKGAFLWTFFIITFISWFMGQTTLPSSIIAQPSVINSISLKLSIIDAFSVPILIFSFLITLFFTTTSIIFGLSKKLGDNKGTTKVIKKVFISDAISNILGTLFGAPFISTRAENITGINEGGKTGLTSLVVALLLFVLLFFSPIISIIPVAAIAPLLIIGGLSLVFSIRGLKKKNYSENIPAYITFFAIPLSFSIPKGVALGFITYTIAKIFAGKAKELPPLTYILSLVFLIFLSIS